MELEWAESEIRLLPGVYAAAAGPDGVVVFVDPFHTAAATEAAVLGVLGILGVTVPLRIVGGATPALPVASARGPARVPAAAAIAAAAAILVAGAASALASLTSGGGAHHPVAAPHALVTPPPVSGAPAPRSPRPVLGPQGATATTTTTTTLPPSLPGPQSVPLLAAGAVPFSVRAASPAPRVVLTATPPSRPPRPIPAGPPPSSPSTPPPSAPTATPPPSAPTLTVPPSTSTVPPTTTVPPTVVIASVPPVVAPPPTTVFGTCPPGGADGRRASVFDSPEWRRAKYGDDDGCRGTSAPGCGDGRSPGTAGGHPRGGDHDDAGTRQAHPVVATPPTAAGPAAAHVSPAPVPAGGQGGDNGERGAGHGGQGDGERGAGHGGQGGQGGQGGHGHAGGRG